MFEIFKKRKIIMYIIYQMCKHNYCFIELNANYFFYFKNHQRNIKNVWKI